MFTIGVVSNWYAGFLISRCAASILVQIKPKIRSIVAAAALMLDANSSFSRTILRISVVKSKLRIVIRPKSMELIVEDFLLCPDVEDQLSIAFKQIARARSRFLSRSQALAFLTVSPRIFDHFANTVISVFRAGAFLTILFFLVFLCRHKK